MDELVRFLDAKAKLDRAIGRLEGQLRDFWVVN